MRKINGPVYNNNLKGFQRRTNESLRRLYNKDKSTIFLSQKNAGMGGKRLAIRGFTH